MSQRRPLLRFSGGAGLTALGLSVDYAFAEEKEEGLGNSQRLSITHRFGGTIVKERREVTVVAAQHAFPR